MTITYVSTTQYHATLYMLGVAWATGYEALHRSVLAQLEKVLTGISGQ